MGAGLYGMLIFVVLAVFIAGLMVGRTPEYLGKKIEAYDVKMVLLALIVLDFCILGFTAWGVVSDWGKSSLANQGPHGLSEILYAFSSGAGNNGSAFAGLNANTPWYNTTLGGEIFFCTSEPARAMIGTIIRKRPISMARPSVVLYHGVLAVSPAKALPLLPVAEL